MKKNLRKIISLVLVLTMSLAISLPAFAAENSSSTTAPLILSNEIVAKADPYIALSKSGNFYISNVTKLQTILTAEEYSVVTLQLENTNKSTPKSNISINQKEKSITISSSESTNASIRATSKEGVNKVEWIWFGIRIYLSKTTVNHILNLQVGAAATYLTIQFPGIGAAVAAFLATYIVTEFGTSHVSRAIYVDVGLKVPGNVIINPTPVGIRGFGFQ